MKENTAPLESGAAGRGGRPGAAQLHVITEDDLKSEFPGPLGPWKSLIQIIRSGCLVAWNLHLNSDKIGGSCALLRVA